MFIQNLLPSGGTGWDTIVLNDSPNPFAEQAARWVKWRVWPACLPGWLLCILATHVRPQGLSPPPHTGLGQQAPWGPYSHLWLWCIPETWGLLGFPFSEIYIPEDHVCRKHSILWDMLIVVEITLHPTRYLVSKVEPRAPQCPPVPPTPAGVSHGHGHF